MSHFNLTSKTFTSRTKRGLSLSLEKKKPLHKIQSLKDTQQKNQQIFRSCHNSPHSSNRKNRIKFVESYQKNQSSSKYEKGRFFKNTDEDIKLGGNKKSTTISRKTIIQPRANLFGMNNNFTLQHSIMTNTKIPQFSDRKVLRQSKVINLTSNINYFQNINSNIEKQQSYDFIPLKNTDVKNISQVTLKQHKNELINPFESLQISNKINNNLFKEPTEQYQQKPLTQTNIHPQKQSINQIAIQKLKKVQTNIDQLLFKVSQTRAYLLR